MNSRSKLLIQLLAFGAAVLLAAAAASWYFTCPCTRVPGGYLLGDEVASPVVDWTFANRVPLCQIEVGDWLRHSVNLNCMAVDGELYLSCAACDGKRWSTLALRNPAGRIRIGDKVYPVTLTRVTDPATLDAAWQARAAKFGRTDTRPRDPGWWSFRLQSR